jgi:hypothetical protein
MEGPAAIRAWSLRTLFALACGVLLPVLTLGSDPELPGRTCMIGTGRSMLPTFPEACRMVVVRVSIEAVKVGERDGDIIATRWNGRGVVHRVIGRRPDGSLVTRGDNNPRPDSFVTTEENYVGVVIGYEKPGAVGELVAPAPRLSSPSPDRSVLAMQE